MNDSVSLKSGKPSVVRMIVPLILAGIAVLYCWYNLLSGEYTPGWQHYIAIAGYSLALILFILNRMIGTFALGIFLLLAIVTACLSYGLFRIGFSLGPIQIPLGNPLAWGIFIVYFTLNMNSLFEYMLDYKERKVKKKSAYL